ncbi:MAG TPA: hypothetical protein DDY17_03870 [Syntrophaceae bacterium]|nr:hypothetical protein [Syntrophaceae bacterium]
MQEIGLNGYEIVELLGSVFLIKRLLQRGLSTMRADLAVAGVGPFGNIGRVGPFAPGRAGW